MHAGVNFYIIFLAYYLLGLTFINDDYNNNNNNNDLR